MDEVKTAIYENLLGTLRAAKDKGLSKVIIATPKDFDYLDFEAYVNRFDKRLIYSSSPSIKNEDPGTIFKIYQTEEAFLNELCSNLTYMYCSSYQKFNIPYIPDYLKPYDIKKWWEYITSRINIVEDMYIDRNGNLIIKITDTIKNIEEEARYKEMEKIYKAQSEAYTRKITRIMEDAINDGRTVVEFTNIDNTTNKPYAIPSAKTMDLINRQSIKHIAPEEVFTFVMELANNDIDKSNERFEDNDLPVIAEKAIGRSAIVNKNINRDFCIYYAEVLDDPNRRTVDNRPYKYIKAYVYILKENLTEENKHAIEVGLRGNINTRISCDIPLCSICGKDICSHTPGKVYDGKICYRVLKGEYEVLGFSFVDSSDNKNTKVIKDSSDDITVVNESEFDKIMGIIYSTFMEFIEGFSYIARDKSLVINLKENKKRRTNKWKKE